MSLTCRLFGHKWVEDTRGVARSVVVCVRCGKKTLWGASAVCGHLGHDYQKGLGIGPCIRCGAAPPPPPPPPPVPAPDPKTCEHDWKVVGTEGYIVGTIFQKRGGGSAYTMRKYKCSLCGSVKADKDDDFLPGQWVLVDGQLQPW